MEEIDSDERRRGCSGRGKGKDVDGEGVKERRRVCDGEGSKSGKSKSMEFLSVAFFGSSLLPYFSGLGGGGELKVLRGKTA